MDINGVTVTVGLAVFAAVVLGVVGIWNYWDNARNINNPKTLNAEIQARRPRH